MSQLKTRFLEDAAVTEPKIANSAVSTDKLANSAVTSAKIGIEEVATTNIADLAITADKIQDGAIINVKLALDSVFTDNLGSEAVTNAKIAPGIDAAKIADGSVSDAEFQRLDGVTSSIQDQLDDKINLTEKGANNGVATLDSGGKIPAAQLPNTVMEFKGQWNASTNTPTLADGVGNAGDVYRVDVAGTQDLGSGPISFDVGDWVMYSGTVWQKATNSNSVVSVNGQQGVVVLDSDDVAEGSSNLYFSDERAQDAVGTILVNTASVQLDYVDATPEISATVLPAGVNHDALQNFVANEHVDHSSVAIATSATSGLSGGGDITTTRNLVVAPQLATSETIASADEILFADVSASNVLRKTTAQAIADLAGPSATPNKELFVLNGTDITNQYVDLAQVALTNSIDFYVRGGGIMVEGASYDYSVSYTGGAGGNTRITFLNNLATGGPSALIAGDVVVVKYQY
jgi:hypothetical protein